MLLFAMHVSKLILFNVTFEVLIVVNVGCYSMQPDRKLPVFQKNMPACSWYTALKIETAGSLKMVKNFCQATWHDISKDGNLQMQFKLQHFL
jgi:hypothetical protein